MPNITEISNPSPYERQQGEGFGSYLLRVAELNEREGRAEAAAADRALYADLVKIHGGVQ